MRFFILTSTRHKVVPKYFETHLSHLSVNLGAEHSNFNQPKSRAFIKPETAGTVIKEGITFANRDLADPALCIYALYGSFMSGVYFSIRISPSVSENNTQCLD